MTRVVALAGGVGGAKLVWGLQRILPPEQLTVIGNTGDDFRHLGLTICPDLDTCMYTMAGLSNPSLGWGVVDETYAGMEMLKRYGGPDWFKLGDRDLGTHLARTEWLATGMSLTQVTAQLCQRLGVHHPLLPMSDQPAPTRIRTPEGVLSFQDWFVRRRWQPTVLEVLLPEPPPLPSPAVSDVLETLSESDLVVIAPSNPLVSVAPILNSAGLRERLASSSARVLAVSPIIGGRAVKGPAAKMMAELGMDVSPFGVARYYRTDLLDGLMMDQEDVSHVSAVEELGMAALAAPTWMHTQEDKIRLAETLIDWGSTL